VAFNEDSAEGAADRCTLRDRYALVVGRDPEGELREVHTHSVVNRGGSYSFVRKNKTPR